MAEQEKMSKAERREQRRLERIEEEAAQAAAASKARIRNAGIGVVSVIAIAGLVYAAVGLDDTVDLSDAVTLTVQEGVDAQDAAGCIVVDDQPLPDATHYQPGEAPAEESIYTDGRPTNSGPHFAQQSGVFDGVSNRQLSELATTHNLEHGSVIVWFDPEQVDGGTTREISSWVSTFNAAGFEQGQTGAGLFASPYEEPGIDSGKAIALRAWGVSLDCDAWNEDAVNAFVIDNFGTNGISPEAALGPYPPGVLAYADGEAEAEVDSEIDPDDLGTMVPTDPTESESEVAE